MSDEPKPKWLDPKTYLDGPKLEDEKGTEEIWNFSRDHSLLRSRHDINDISDEQYIVEYSALADRIITFVRERMLRIDSVDELELLQKTIHREFSSDSQIAKQTDILIKGRREELGGI